MKSIHDFANKKKKNEKITMATCYDYAFAQILNNSTIDTLLIGDSVSQVVHGYPSTVYATIEMMALHTQAVSKGAPTKFIVADMPFMSTRKGLKTAMTDIQKLMTSGAHAVKIEGADGHEKLIRHIVDSGVPVMGHLGLTPQSIHQLGGPKIQAKTDEQAEKLLADALKLEKAGCFCIVLELVPAHVAKKVTESLSIPTIGIGAGGDTTGQVLVLQDLLGMNPNFKPKFLKKYVELYNPILEAVNSYAHEVSNKQFPLPEHSY